MEHTLLLFIRTRKIVIAIADLYLLELIASFRVQYFVLGLIFTIILSLLLRSRYLIIGIHAFLPTWLIPLIGIPIDHCLVSKDFGVSRIHTGDNSNSDHAPLIVDLMLN
jgi:hypothetical protein